MKDLQYPTPKKNGWKILALILLLIVVGGLGYWGYLASYQDGYTQGFDEGNIWVISYQTQNQKVFLFYENRTMEIPFQQLCGGGQ